MKSERPTREELIELAKRDPEAIADLVLALWDRVEELEARIAALERNSRNSSKPPSSDQGNFTNPPKPKPKSLRKKSKRKPGGQKGHRGSNLSQVEKPDHIIEHRFSSGEDCPHCGSQVHPATPDIALEQCGSYEKRQVFDLPPIEVEVTEHRAERCHCFGCGKTLTAGFPDEVNASVQYGPTLQAMALYLGKYQLIPYLRLSELFDDIFSCPLSIGTLANFVKRGGAKAAEAVKPIREALREASVLHADETGCRLHGVRHWLHVACTTTLTYFHIDAKRGSEALRRMGILEKFTNKVIHDFYSSYYTLKKCAHFLCNAHLLRELIYVDEEMKQEWAGEMKELLLEAKKLRAREDENKRRRARDPEFKTRRVIGEQTRRRIQSHYMKIVSKGYEANPEPPPQPGKRGKPKRGKALNLLIRLEQRYEEIMGFFEYEDVPFDNNQAERDLRMMKTREKISGTFRSSQHAKAFCDLRSVISTARKQSRCVLDCISELIHSPKALGVSLINSGGGE